MIDKLIQFSIARRWLVMFLVLVIGALGVWNYQQLPIDAVPDITNVQVQINTEAPGYSPLEVEQRITYHPARCVRPLHHRAHRFLARRPVLHAPHSERFHRDLWQRVP